MGRNIISSSNRGESHIQSQRSPNFGQICCFSAITSARDVHLNDLMLFGRKGI